MWIEGDQGQEGRWKDDEGLHDIFESNLLKVEIGTTHRLNSVVWNIFFFKKNDIFFN